MKFLSAFLIGIVFGVGIAISGMANPAKVLNFFDIAGSWDPSLLLVMGGALLTTAVGYRVLFSNRSKPVLEDQYALPAVNRIDLPLIAGSATFGIGWGITGFCPGGAIPALGFGGTDAVIFVAAMAAGIMAARMMMLRRAAQATA